MERERIKRENVSRTIQPKNNFGGTYMVDLRSDKNHNYLSDSSLQRISDEEEETLQGKFDTPVQRISEDDEDTVQGKFYKPIQKKNETGMPDNLKAGIESLSGFSMDEVHVHYNSSKPATVQALAYTQGTDIHVAPGQEKHLPHEAWHVAQQMAGRVSPTTSINGMLVNDNTALEHEADVMGEKAVQCKEKSSLFLHKNIISSLSIQRTQCWKSNFNNGDVGSKNVDEKNICYVSTHKDESNDQLYRSLNDARKGVVAFINGYAKSKDWRIKRLNHDDKYKNGALGGKETLLCCKNISGEIMEFVGFSYEPDDENCTLTKYTKGKAGEESGPVKHFHAICHDVDKEAGKMKEGKYAHIDGSAAHYLVLPEDFRSK